MGKIISIVSGKGGVGKSVCSISIAHSLVKKRGKVLVIELDNGLKTLDILAGCTEKSVFNLGDVLNNRCKPVDAIISASYHHNLHILPCSPNHDEIMTSEDIIELCKGVSKGTQKRG